MWYRTLCLRLKQGYINSNYPKKQDLSGPKSLTSSHAETQSLGVMMETVIGVYHRSLSTAKCTSMKMLHYIFNDFIPGFFLNYFSPSTINCCLEDYHWRITIGNSGPCINIRQRQLGIISHEAEDNTSHLESKSRGSQIVSVSKSYA